MMEEQLKGTIVPLIRPEQFKLYSDLGMPKQLDRQVAKVPSFVSTQHAVCLRGLCSLISL